MNREGLVYTIIFTFFLGLVFVFALGAVELSTREQVQLNAEINEYRAVLDSVGQPPAEKATAESVASAFRKLFPDQTDGVSYPLQAVVGGESLIVDRFKGGGLWGNISGVIAVNNQVDKIVGLTVIEQQETPGLGGRITQDWFKDQFRGEMVGERIRVAPAQGGSGDADHANGRFDAIAGATLTSRYMEVIVNDAIKSLRDRRDNGGLA